MSDIRLVALDLDGTLFNNQSIISDVNLAAINHACESNTVVAISTGRPYAGLPLNQLEGSGIQYAITANGSALYEIATKKCIYEDSMEPSLILPILRHLLTLDIHMDVFIHGDAYSPAQCLKTAQKLASPASIKKYIIETRTRLDNLPEYIEEHQLHVQKMTLNFYPDENGVLVDREKAKAYLNSIPAITCVSGGYNNLEFTKAGVDKGVGLGKLAAFLGIPMECTMALGDTENDIEILKAAHIGIAMGNATPAVKAVADDITLSNEEDGVAAAFSKYLT